jgi:Uma2 family endonuclease
MATTLKQKLDYSDYAAIPEDGKRWEIIDGEPYVTPAPNPFHQRASRRLQRQLEDYFAPRGGEVFDAPIDLILSPQDVVQPDLVVVLDASLVTRRGIEGGPPALVVEVLSPSTSARDRALKARLYASAGIPQYWLLDPEARSLEVFHLEQGAAGPTRGYRLAASAAVPIETPMAVPGWDGLGIDLAAVFA